MLARFPTYKLMLRTGVIEMQCEEVLVFQGRIRPVLSKVIKEYFLSPNKSFDKVNGSGTGNCGFPIDACFDVLKVVFFIWLILIVL